VGSVNGIFTYDGFIRTVPYNGRNGLPLLFVADPTTINSFLDLPAPISCINDYAQALLSTEVPPLPTTNLSKVQQKLLHVHECMAHLGFDNIQQLARDGYFGDTLHCIGSCDKPLCHACCMGKAHKRHVSTNTSPLKATHIQPGDCISCDQLESNAPGRIAILKGKPSKKFYHACTFFIDHASNKVHISLHQSTGADEAVLTKHHFEKLAAEHGIYLHKYHGDNGVFATHIFLSYFEPSF
jgi:hypothetical protein